MLKILLLMSLYIVTYANINYKTNIDKDTFLNLDSKSYTIDLATLYDFEGYKVIKKELDNTSNIYAFEFGANKNKLATKVLFGSFNKYSDALATLRIFPKHIQKNKPLIVEIKKYQKLMKKYHTKNEIRIIEPYIKELNALPALQYTFQDKVSFLKSLEYVFNNHPDLKEQSYLIKAAKNEKDIQKALFLPTVDTNYDNTKYINSYDSASTDIKTKTISKDITAKWNIFRGFQDYNQYQQKQKAYTSSFFNKENITNELVFKFVESYIEYAKVQKRYSIAKDHLSIYKEYADQMSLKSKYGMSSLTSRIFISKKYIDTQINFIELNKKQYNNALYDLQKYININEQSKVISAFEELDIDMSSYTLQSLLDTGLEFHPLILQASSDIDVAKIEYAKEHKGYLPTLDLVLKKGEVESGYEDRVDFTEDTSVKFQFKMNLYNGGKDYNSIKKRLNEYKQKQQKYQSVILDINFKIKTSFYNLKILEERQKLVDESLEENKKGFKAAKYDHEFAKINQEQLIGVMEGLKNAKQKSLEIKYEILVAKYKVLSSTGILTQYLQDSLNKRVIK